MTITKWMSWEGGVDLVGMTQPGLPMPNIIVHVARIVHTPVGSAPAGMVLYMPDPAKGPVVMGFVSENETVGKFFGPNIFAGTPFEQAPVLLGKINIDLAAPGAARAVVDVAGHVFETNLSGLQDTQVIHRIPGAMTPFYQQGIESAASSATLKVNSKQVPLNLPPQGIGGGPAAVLAAVGVYCR